MKVTIDIDCTPAEARAFLGLPEVAPLQQAMMQEVERRLMASLGSMDPEALWKTWLPAGAQGLEQMQRFWAQFAGAAAGGKRGKGA